MFIPFSIERFREKFLMYNYNHHCYINDPDSDMTAFIWMDGEHNFFMTYCGIGIMTEPCDEYGHEYYTRDMVDELGGINTMSGRVWLIGWMEDC